MRENKKALSGGQMYKRRNMNAIKAFMQENETMKRKELRARCSVELGLSKRTAKEYIQDLLDAGYLTEETQDDAESVLIYAG